MGYQNHISCKRKIKEIEDLLAEEEAIPDFIKRVILSSLKRSGILEVELDRIIEVLNQELRKIKG